jgi:hypothetical protein
VNPLSWTPAELQEAHAGLKALSSDAWVRDELHALSWMRFEKHTPADYLRGIGTASETLGVVERLSTDLRMKDVWSRLSKLEANARAGKISRVFDLGNEIVCCGIAARSAYCVVERKEVVTRATWTERHESIARVAAELSKLLKPSPSMEPEFQNIASMFTSGHFRAIASELHGYTLETSFPNGPPSIEEIESFLGEQQSESPEQIAASNAIWEREVNDLADWLEQSMSHHPIALSSDVLDRMVELALLASRNPPFVAPADGVRRQIFMLSGSLFQYFRMFFARPLDDVVATIASVVTDQDVSTESVKMRRQRWREHTQRPVK